MDRMSTTDRMAAGMVAALAAGWLAWAGVAGPGSVPPAHATEPAQIVPVQVPYDAPPKPPQEIPDVAVPPANKLLDAEEIKRAEALLPLLDGKQEFWAMGEFVHLGPPAVPVLVKALAMPSSRIRYNAIETLLMIKDPGAVPALLDTAKDPNEIARVREHALRTSVRLNAVLAPPAIEVMAKDPNPTIRKAAAFESRYVRYKAVVPVLIGLLPDEERFVALTALQSLWMVTRHESEMHDWDASTQQERQEWAEEWVDWWKNVQDSFEIPDPRKPRKPI